MLSPRWYLLLLGVGVAGTLACGQADSSVAPLPTTPETSLTEPVVPPSSAEVPAESAQPGFERNPAPPLLTDRDLDSFVSEFGSGTALAVAGLADDTVLSTSELLDPFAWSTAKVPLAVLTIQNAGGLDRLSEQQRSDIVAAVTASDNDAAARLWQGSVDLAGSPELAAAEVNVLFGLAGDETTKLSTTGRAWFSSYGQTAWQPADQVLFLRALFQRCYLSNDDTEWLVELMQNVVPEQRWGLLRVPGAAAKGGWGPDEDGTYLVRQFGFMPDSDGDILAAAVATRANDGSYGTAVESLDRIVAWVRNRVDASGTVPACPVDRST